MARSRWVLGWALHPQISVVPRQDQWHIILCALPYATHSVLSSTAGSPPFSFPSFPSLSFPHFFPFLLPFPSLPLYTSHSLLFISLPFPSLCPLVCLAEMLINIANATWYKIYYSVSYEFVNLADLSGEGLKLELEYASQIFGYPLLSWWVSSVLDVIYNMKTRYI